MEKIALAIFAHPDDAEMMCAGTLSLLQKHGWSIHMATMTPGDKGSAVLTSDEIGTIRKSEAVKSAQILDATYDCLDLKDVYILYDRDSINRTTGLIRKIKPSLVFTHSPADYMIDHEKTCMIVQTACFASGIKNMEVTESPFEQVPTLYYCDAMEGKDKLGNNIQPSFYVDITSEIELKKEMLKCHDSQRSWLLKHHKIDEYILAMEKFSAMRGEEINTGYAEGFRQHLGHGYPQENVLTSVLNNLVVIK